MGCLFQTYLSDEIYFSGHVNTETALLCLLQASIKKDKQTDILDNEDSRASKFCWRERELLIQQWRVHKPMMRSIKRVKLVYGR